MKKSGDRELSATEYAVRTQGLGAGQGSGTVMQRGHLSWTLEAAQEPSRWGMLS